MRSNDCCCRMLDKRESARPSADEVAAELTKLTAPHAAGDLDSWTGRVNEPRECTICRRSARP